MKLRRSAKNPADQASREDNESRTQRISMFVPTLARPIRPGQVEASTIRTAFGRVGIDRVRRRNDQRPLLNLIVNGLPLRVPESSPRAMLNEYLPTGDANRHPLNGSLGFGPGAGESAMT